MDFVRSVMAGDHLREEEHILLETLMANVPQSRTVKSNSLELTPSNTPQLSPTTTPANKKNRNLGTYLSYCYCACAATGFLTDRITYCLMMYDVHLQYLSFPL